MPTTVHLIRHATYDLLERGILAGRTPGWKLNEAGIAQAAMLARAMSTRPLAAIVASPLERAQQTAQAIAAAQGLQIETDPRLEEVDFGAWTGTSFSAIRDDPGWIAFNALRSFTAPPGGESMLDVQLRAVEAMRTVATRFPAGEVALVTHGDVIRAALVHALGMALDLFHRLEVGPASRSTVLVGDGILRVLCLNAPP